MRYRAVGVLGKRRPPDRRGSRPSRLRVFTLLPGVHGQRTYRTDLARDHAAPPGSRQPYHATPAALPQSSPVLTLPVLDVDWATTGVLVALGGLVAANRRAGNPPERADERADGQHAPRERPPVAAGGRIEGSRGRPVLTGSRRTSVRTRSDQWSRTWLSRGPSHRKLLSLNALPSPADSHLRHHLFPITRADLDYGGWRLLQEALVELRATHGGRGPAGWWMKQTPPPGPSHPAATAPPPSSPAPAAEERARVASAVAAARAPALRRAYAASTTGPLKSHGKARCERLVAVLAQAVLQLAQHRGEVAAQHRGHRQP